MKKIYTFIIGILLTTAMIGQAPSSFKYQAVLRDTRGGIRANAATTITISILQGSTIGTSVYTETHNTTTDGFGLINLEIGKGTATSGTFASINWGTGTYFVKVTVDGVEMGTSQLLSVPYALYAANAGNGFSGSYLDLTNKPVLFNGTWTSLTGKPTFATVATSGSYGDLTNKPTITNGTVTSVTGTAPITIATGTSTPVISLAQANGTTNGYLSSTDWTTFNNKSSFDGKWTSLTGKPTLATVATSGSYDDLTDTPTITNGTVTSVSGTSPVSVTSGTTTPVISMVKASATTNGYLSSTDWTTFNNKSSFDGKWSSLTAKPTTIAGYGITDAVSTSGNQTINGNKTFTGTTTVGKPLNASDAATKAYVDSIKKDVKLELYAENGVTDVDGNSYKVVKIGTQIWMAENLKTTKYNDGTSIPLVPDAWAGLTTPAYCWLYNNEAVFKADYGALYNWYTVNTGKLCPANWHVPSDTEWTVMTTYLGGESISGGKLKENGITHWTSPNTGATNETGFTARAGGSRTGLSGYGTGFNEPGAFSLWWSTTIISGSTVWRRFLTYSNTTVTRDYSYKFDGISVRCVKDASSGGTITSLATVATSGSYNDLLNKPALRTTSSGDTLYFGSDNFVIIPGISAANSSGFVFARTVSGYEQIFSANIDFSVIKQLTSENINCYHPKISPDGKKVVYSRGSGMQYDIWFMNIDGSNKTKITTTNVNNLLPAWHNNGKEVIYEYNNGIDTKVVLRIVRIDGTNDRLLINTGNKDRMPSMNPADSNYVSFYYDSGNWAFSSDIRIRNLTNSTDAILVSSDGWAKNTPKYSHNGQFIIWEDIGNGTGVRLKTVNTSSKLNTVIETQTGSNAHLFGIYSPDDKFIYHLRRSTSLTTDVIKRNADGTNPVVIYTGDNINWLDMR